MFSDFIPLSCIYSVISSFAMSGHLVRRSDLQPSCPQGGTYYACDYGSRFLGCCTSNPCDKGCPTGGLHVMTFNTQYTLKAAGACAAGAQWWRCPNMSSAFIGCCRINACKNNGCPSANLTGAILPGNTQQKAPFKPFNTAPSSSNKTAIIGGVCGAIGGLIILVVLLAAWRWRKARLSRRDHQATSASAFLSRSSRVCTIYIYIYIYIGFR